MRSLRPTATSLGLPFVLGFASLGTVQKYAGTALAFVYLAALLVALPVVISYGTPLFLRLTTERSALWLGSATLVALIVEFAVVYPHANSHANSVGSDRDEGANIATNRLLRLQYPHYATTYLGNHITQLPGALVLAISFVLIGNSALQNIFWLPALFAGVRARTGSNRIALFACWLLLAASPAVLREYVTGGDLIANGIYVLLASSRGGWWSVAAAVALDLTLSSRANFLLVLPLLAAGLLQSAGRRRAVIGTAVAWAAFGALTLPFYLCDRAAFSPFRDGDKLSQFDSVLPHAQTVIRLLAVLLTIALCFTRMRADGVALARNAAAVQLFILLFAVALDSADAGKATFGFLISGYGLNAVFFAFFAAAVAAVAAGTTPGAAEGTRTSQVLRKDTSERIP